MPFKLYSDMPDEVLIELGRLAACAGQIEFTAFSLVHELLDSDLPGLHEALAIAGDLTFAQTLNLARKLADLRLATPGPAFEQFEEWRKEAGLFMQRRNSLLHANWLTDKNNQIYPMSRKNLRIDSQLDLDELRQALAEGKRTSQSGLRVINSIQLEMGND